jgi:hypothetical protein
MDFTNSTHKEHVPVLYGKYAQCWLKYVRYIILINRQNRCETKGLELTSRFKGLTHCYLCIICTSPSVSLEALRKHLTSNHVEEEKIQQFREELDNEKVEYSNSIYHIYTLTPLLVLRTWGAAPYNPQKIVLQRLLKDYYTASKIDALEEVWVFKQKIIGEQGCICNY